MLLFVLLLRRFGTANAGIYTLSVAYLTFSVLFSSLGLDELILREVAKDPSCSYCYLVNAALLRVVLGVIGYGILALVVILILRYEPEVYRVILILGIAVIPESVVATASAVFVANRKMSRMALVACGTGLLQLGLGSIAIAMGAGLTVIAWTVTGSSCLGAAIGLYIAYRLVAQLHSETTATPLSSTTLVSMDFCRMLVERALPFFLLIGLVSLDAELDIILLSMFGDVDEVGLYGAARSIVLVFLLLSQSLRMVVYPIMSRAYATSESALRRVYREAWFYLGLAGFPIAIGGLFISRDLLFLVYGDTPKTATWTLNILFGHLLATFLYQAGTRLLVVSNRQLLLARFLGVSIVVNVSANILITPKYGAVGAAVARTIASSIYFLMVEWYVNRSLLSNVLPFRHLSVLLLATATMSITLAVIDLSPWSAKVLMGAGIYTLVVAVLLRSDRIRAVERPSQ